MSACLIYATGGHAKVIAEIVRLNYMEVIAFFADNATEGMLFKGLPVHIYDGAENAHLPVIIAIGNNTIRKRIADLLSHTTISLIHPAAVVSSDAKLGEGTVVLAGAILQADSIVGKHCIINISSSIEHDAIVGDFAHIGPHSYIGGGAVIGEGALIGAGSVIMRNTQIPAWSDVPPGSIIM
jgi:sugar O-acyltransferase (sialic acid O-acetyltransferase NeuD family)